ncbi:MAG TPA: hypothetical protein PLU72_09190 [Candidatus Ozemobacteraceae bacterium]|nr:hypothetical protein [Candidatus Ozemobacteraceae bacterium]HQG27320.1 hypothetical protein [Candidatus Ozemobacteraceae bacterium]
MCPSCLRAVTWPSAPPRSRRASVVVRRGRDAFIRGPNDAHPAARAASNAGGPSSGPLGSWYSATGLRYLVRFDIPEACGEAGIDPASWTPARATLVVRVTPDGDAREDVPLVVYALARPFEEGAGFPGMNFRNERGCTWFRATTELPWATAGGDYFSQPRAWGKLPRTGAAEVEIDVTDIIRTIFDAYHKTGRWEDFGLILMRDPEAPARCTYRTIFSLEATPCTGISRAARSPELLLE